MWMLDGRNVRNLEQIPKECKMILVSEQQPPEIAIEDGLVEKAFVTGVDPKRQISSNPLPLKSTIKGLVNNIYDFTSEEEAHKLKLNKIEKIITNK